MRTEAGAVHLYAFAFGGLVVFNASTACSTDTTDQEEASTEPIRHVLSVEFDDGRRFHDGSFFISFREDQPDYVDLTFGALQFDTGRKVVFGGPIARPLNPRSFEVNLPSATMASNPAYLRVECSDDLECSGPVERASSARAVFALADLGDSTGRVNAVPASLSASIVGPWEAVCSARSSSFGFEGEGIREDSEWTTPFCAAALAEFDGMRPSIVNAE